MYLMMWVLTVLLLLVLIAVVSTPTRTACISSILGVVFGCGVVLSYSVHDMRFLGFYIMILTFFHVSEYIATSIYNPHTLTVDSFLLNHSKEYALAAIGSWLEYSIEYYFFPSLKLCWFIGIIGALVSVSGEALRKIAMVTAGSNFTHNVQIYKRHHHKLVTTGIYKYFRHPSYVGWFYWSLGTQLLLCNPICLIGYILASWHFFKDRIETEEEFLIHFFGKDYQDYQKNVCTGLPFIKGYVSDHTH